MRKPARLQITDDMHKVAVGVSDLRQERDSWKEQAQEAWSALRMIREAIEEVGPVGVLPSEEAVNASGGLTYLAEAEALVAGIQKLAAKPFF